MFDPVDFFQLARHLALGNEAEIRTCVGRAYYACFLLGKDKLRLRSSGPQIHEKVLQRFRSVGQPKMAQRLARLRRLRNLSDYNTSVTIDYAEAQRALALASALLRWLRQI